MPLPTSRLVRRKLGSESVVCIVCGQQTEHELFVSGVRGVLRRRTPQTELRHYSLCRACGTKIPRKMDDLIPPARGGSGRTELPASHKHRQH